MDVKTLIESNKIRFNLNSQKEQLKEKYQSKLIFADQGGLWKVTPEFLAFLNVSPHSKFVVLDLYDNPVKIDATQLLSKATKIYNETMDAWHQEFEELRNKR